MIKVNLLRDIGGYSSADSGGGSASSGMGGAGANAVRSTVESTEGQIDAAVKLLAVFLPLILAFGYRSYEENVLKTQLKQLRARSAEIKEKLTTYDPALKEIEKFQEEKRKLDSQLDVIAQLSKDRLKNIRALAGLQEIMPQRVWLKSLTIDGDKFEMEGNAMEDGVISDFVGALEASIFFQNVLIDGIKKETERDLQVKSFKLHGLLESH